MSKHPDISKVREYLIESGYPEDGDALLSLAAVEAELDSKSPIESALTKADAVDYASAQVEQSLDIRMHGLNITDGKMALELGTDMAKIMAEAYLGMLDTMGAVNYCELEMHVGDGRKLLVTVQRLERPTAHDLRLAAEAKFDALLLQVAAGQTGDR